MATSTTPTTHKPTIKRGSKPYLYHVESKTHAGTWYVVSVHHLSCSCPAGRYQRGCWHLRISLAYHDWRTRQHVQHSAPAAGMAGLHESVA